MIAVTDCSVFEPPYAQSNHSLMNPRSNPNNLRPICKLQSDVSKFRFVTLIPKHATTSGTNTRRPHPFLNAIRHSRTFAQLPSLSSSMRQTTLCRISFAQLARRILVTFLHPVCMVTTWTTILVGKQTFTPFLVVAVPVHVSLPSLPWIDSLQDVVPLPCMVRVVHTFVWGRHRTWAIDVTFPVDSVESGIEDTVCLARFHLGDEAVVDDFADPLNAFIAE